MRSEDSRLKPISMIHIAPLDYLLKYTEGDMLTDSAITISTLCMKI